MTYTITKGVMDAMVKHEEGLRAENARLMERLARVTEAVRMERSTLHDLLDADNWIGYATPLAAVERIAGALVEKGAE